jgi:preprotein translocase subunit SecG
MHMAIEGPFMFYVLAAAGLPWYHYIYSIPLCIVSIFLILVVLVQRGRGGGLTGALGGMGGQSAFGTKAGDLFTKITIVVAAIWILLAMLTIQRLARPTAAKSRDAAPAQKEQEDGKKDASDKGKAADTKKKTDAGKPTGKTTGTGGSDAKASSATTDKSGDKKQD